MDVDGNRRQHKALRLLSRGRSQPEWANDFMQDCSERIVGRPQIQRMRTSRICGPWKRRSEPTRTMRCSIRSTARRTSETRYSPATCIGCDMKVVSGDPDPKHVSTSFVERQNLTMRMSMRRFTRLTNGFSKKIENHGHAVALHFMHYNFCRVHSSLRVTPAMEAGLAHQVWTIEDLVIRLLSPNAVRIAA